MFEKLFPFTISFVVSVGFFVARTEILLKQYRSQIEELKKDVEALKSTNINDAVLTEKINNLLDNFTKLEVRVGIIAETLSKRVNID